MNTINLQLFADAGTLVNATGGTVNAHTGAVTAGSGMSSAMKTYYDTELLDNARAKLVFTQLGKKQALPKNHGESVEWRKWNTFPKALTPLVEGVIPTGQQFGQTAINVSVQQYGDYAAISDRLDLHAIDDVILGAAEEMGAAGGETADTLVRNELMTGTNVIFCDNINASTGAVTTPASRDALVANNNRLTPDMVNKAYTMLKKQKAPYFEGNKYVAVIHPSVAYDLRSSRDWIEAHKYSEAREIFAGEIGELHGVRFIESTEAPIVKNANNVIVYATLFFGKGAFGVVDPEGMGMEMIIKDASQVGGPLNQFSTVGYKFESATKILYQNRMVRVEGCSAYSTVDSVN